jgi:hypothetical protein
VARRLKDLRLDEQTVQRIAENLGPMVEDRARERAAPFQAEAEQLRRDAQRTEAEIRLLKSCAQVVGEPPAPPEGVILLPDR